MRTIMDGEATPAQIGALLTALRMKGETVHEIAGFAEIMREKACPASAQPEGRAGYMRHRRLGDPQIQYIDDCQRSSAQHSASPWRSTAIGRCPARAAAPMCWRRSASTSRSTTSKRRRCLEEIGICFMFAQNVSSIDETCCRTAQGARHPQRSSICSARSTNPARAEHQVMGIYDRTKTELDRRCA